MTTEQKRKKLDKDIRNAVGEKRLAMFNHNYQLAAAWGNVIKELKAEKELLEAPNDETLDT